MLVISKYIATQNNLITKFVIPFSRCLWKSLLQTGLFITREHVVYHSSDIKILQNMSLTLGGCHSWCVLLAIVWSLRRDSRRAFKLWVVSPFSMLLLCSSSIAPSWLCSSLSWRYSSSAILRESSASFFRKLSNWSCSHKNKYKFIIHNFSWETVENHWTNGISLGNNAMFICFRTISAISL